jgi:hypothetical protein
MASFPTEGARHVHRRFSGLGMTHKQLKIINISWIDPPDCTPWNRDGTIIQISRDGMDQVKL